MTKIVTKALPHGRVPFADVADVTVRDRIMRLSENIVSLSKQLATVQAAVNEMQKKDSSVVSADAEAEASAAQAAASASSAAVSATSALSAAEEARDAAIAANAVILAFRNVDLGASVQMSTFSLADFVTDSDKTYCVNVKFTNEAATARSCKVNSETISLANAIGATSETTLSLAGTESFTVDNIVATVQVVIRIS